MKSLCLAFYCSGHGYGHATRVSALTRQLLSLESRPVVHIVSSAPKHVFLDCLAFGALYRFAEIDPVISQPLAYRVDRQKSVDVLRSFLNLKESKLEQERRWLLEISASCVLSDAAFLGCLAAKAAQIPSILITNFTFDSVYSYLSTDLSDGSPLPNNASLHPPVHSGIVDALVPDIPVPPEDLAPLVQEIHAGYSCAHLLILLPGAIPIPSFPGFEQLPATSWVDPSSQTFRPHIKRSLLHHHRSSYPPLSTRIRSTFPAPLLVRPPSSHPDTSPYTAAGRARLLDSVGVPSHLHNAERTRILVVSFGGQVVRQPRGRTGSGSRSTRVTSPTHYGSSPENGVRNIKGLGFQLHHLSHTLPPQIYTPSADSAGSVDGCTPSPRRLVTPSHIWIPGAPPAAKPHPTPPLSSVEFAADFTLNGVPPSPANGCDGITSDDEEIARLLPDENWIAIVCGVSKEQWLDQQCGDDGLPDGFYVAPRDVYMPDLTAVGDVLLGKLGYGTVSECIDSCTPFVYVSRPLFIEEHGLRLFLEEEGVGEELERGAYERGEWAMPVLHAWERGKERKREKREEERKAIGVKKGNDVRIAKRVVEWVEEWWETDTADGF